MADLTMSGHVGGQLARLCEVVGADPAEPLDLMVGLLGPVGARPLAESPAWPSDVSDDHTPIEFSVAFNEAEPPTLRVLGETLGSPPSPRANLSATRGFLAARARANSLSTTRLDAIWDLFDTDDPQGEFALWCSLVFRSQRRPELKVYLNPEVRGVQRAPALVAEALRRLGLGASYRTLLDYGVRPGELGRADRLTFFAVDLHDGPQARVKLYLTHHDAEAWDLIRAAGAVDGLDVGQIAEFCALTGGGIRRFTGRPLVGSYTFTEGSDRPVGYSVYVPIRSYVDDDEEARDRVAAVLTRYGFDPAELDRAIAAVTRRPLRDGVGLIAHASLRLGAPRPGVTVYLSAEAYRTNPPRQRPVLVGREPAASAAAGRP
jgi:DMATS type aromatic prenyltransferase